MSKAYIPNTVRPDVSAAAVAARKAGKPARLTAHQWLSFVVGVAFMVFVLFCVVVNFI